MANYLIDYFNEIERGRIRVSSDVHVVIGRLVDEIEHEKYGYHFDVHRANYPIKFIETFCVPATSRDKTPIKLSLFQKAIISAIYGFIDDDGLRRFREVFWLMARKNGKSTLCSALSLYHLVADGEKGAQVYSLATTRDQAKTVFDECVAMMNSSPALTQLLHKTRTSITFKDINGFIAPLASESDTLDGKNSSCVIMDEIHAWKDRNLYDVMLQSTSSRQQPIIYEITTNGFTRDGLFDAQLSVAESVVKDEDIDIHMLPLLYRLDNEDQLLDEKNWEIANPNLGVTKKIDTLRSFVSKASVDEQFKPTLLTKDFNLPSNPATAWLPYDAIINKGTFDLSDFKGGYFVGGCDLSAVIDLTCATAILLKPSDPDKIFVAQKYFIPSCKLDVADKKGGGYKEAPYRLWADQGWITVSGTNHIDYSDVTAWFRSLRDDYDILPFKIGYDVAMSTYWVPQMEAEFGTTVMEKIRQGSFTFSQPMKLLGARFRDKQVIYNRNPILEWCTSNVSVKATSQSIDMITPIKVKRDMKIDGFVSLLNAYVVYCKNEDTFKLLNNFEEVDTAHEVV